MRNKSTLSRLDDWLLVGVITVVAAWVVFHLIAGLVGLALFLIKVAIVIAIGGVTYKAIAGRRSRELDGGRRRRSLHR
jgi:hypothetical protein